MRANDDAIHHNLTPMKAVSARLTTKTAKALRLADSSPTPTSISRSRCRTPAHRWWRNAHRETISPSFQIGARRYSAARAKPLSDERLESRRNRNASKPRKSAKPLMRWKIETRPGTGRLRGLRLYQRGRFSRSEEHTSELQSRLHLVCRLLLEKKKKRTKKAE